MLEAQAVCNYNCSHEILSVFSFFLLCRTFVCVYTCLGQCSAIDSMLNKIACRPIGCTEIISSQHCMALLDHVRVYVQVPYEGSGMNPARAFGPAAVSGWLKDHVDTHAVSINIFVAHCRPAHCSVA